MMAVQLGICIMTIISHGELSCIFVTLLLDFGLILLNLHDCSRDCSRF